MTVFQYLRTRFAIWRLERRIDAAIESENYHLQLGHLALSIAKRERLAVRAAKQELERVATALSQGVAA